MLFLYGGLIDNSTTLLSFSTSKVVVVPLRAEDLLERLGSALLA